MTSSTVYVVTSYINPHQTIRLLSRIRAESPAARLIVSHDRKMPPPPAAELRAVGAELWLTPEGIEWGDATYLRSQLAVLGNLEMEDDTWITFLTGQDYPVRSIADYEQHLAACGADALLEVPDDDPSLGIHLQRYLVRSYRMPRWVDKHTIRRVVNRLPGFELSHEPRGQPPYLHRRRFRTPFSESFSLRKGCDLFALSGRAARALGDAPPSLLRYYAHTRVPSESYVHTVLRNHPSLTITGEMIHFARWASSPHPDWLGIGDLDEMITSRRWFARKFREDDPVLDVLDRSLQGDGVGPD